MQSQLPSRDDIQTRIDLIEWIRPCWTNENDDRAATEQLPRVMALLTRNIRRAFDDLVSQGLTPTQPLRPADSSIGVQGVVCFTDPDGHIVELIEYFGDQLGSRTDELPER